MSNMKHLLIRIFFKIDEESFITVRNISKDSNFYVAGIFDLKFAHLFDKAF